jgi:hypothetical protein
MATKKTYSLPRREECQKSPEIAATLDTHIMTATAEDTKNAEQVDYSEGMTMDKYGPFDNSEDTREMCGEQAATIATSNALITETDVAMDEGKPRQHEKQHKDSKVRTGSPPLPPQMMKQLHFIQRLVQKEPRSQGWKETRP